MKFQRVNGELVVRMIPEEALALGRILTHAAPGITATDPAAGSAWVELAGVVEAYTDEAVIGTAGVLETLDGDRDAIESDGESAKVWRSAWDAGAGEAS